MRDFRLAQARASDSSAADDAEFMLVSVSASSGSARNRRRVEISAVDDSSRNGQNLAKLVTWRSGRVVEGSGFENRRGGNSTRGSNPFFSAELSLRAQ
jgi:hypothetical protein